MANYFKVVKMKLYVFIMLVLFSSYSAATVHVSTITVSQIDSFRLHTSKHYSSPTHNIATLRTSALLDTCSRGVFLDAETDQATYAAMMAAYLAGRDMEIRYDSNIGAPWGDTNYCAIIHFDIK